MKRNFIVILVMFLTVISVSHAIPISDTLNHHNMSNLATHSGPKATSTAAGGTDQICVFCHTPHSSAPQSPLWHRPDPDLMGSFPVYAQPLVIKSNPGVSGYSAGNPEYPSGASRMCLSCHDGTTSLGVLLGNQTIVMDGVTTLSGRSSQINLATSHPVSFIYNSTIVGLLGGTNYQLPGSGVDSPLDSAGQMQCTTCHDPHEDTSEDDTYDRLPFWRHKGDTTSYDDVCNNCHIASPNSGSLPHTLP